MKLVYTSLLFFYSVSLFAQESQLLRRVQGELGVTGVVSLDSFSAAQLYFNSVLFLNEVFSGIRETSQIKDEKAKYLATKGSIPVSVVNDYGEEINAKVVFTFVIQCRENAYKYTLKDFHFAYTEKSGVTTYASFNDQRGIAMTQKQWQHVHEQTEEFVIAFVADLKQQMAQKEILRKERQTTKKKKGSGK